MVEFRWHRRKADRTPIISDMDIIRFTEEVLSDYKPEHLEKPGKLDPEHFIERYLGATIDYQDIYYPKDGSSIAGATIFNRDHVAVLDKEHGIVRSILVEPGTIILDNSILDDRYWGFAEFTAMHEGGHFQMHPEVYERNGEQIDFFSLGLMRPADMMNGVLCKRSNIGRSNIKLVTDEDFREHQANTYAASMLMPRRTFIPFIAEENKKIGYSNGIFVQMPEYSIRENQALRSVIATAARKYGVSRSAVKVNMQKYGLLTKAEGYRAAEHRLLKYSYY